MCRGRGALRVAPLGCVTSDVTCQQHPLSVSVHSDVRDVAQPPLFVAAAELVETSA